MIALHRPVLLIGRHLDCDVRIDSPKISRRHCCLAMAYDRVLIRDLGSRNGVRVNGRLVEESRLYPGDELAIGPILFRLEAESDDPEIVGAPVSRPTQPPRAARPARPAGQCPRRDRCPVSRDPILTSISFRSRDSDGAAPQIPLNCDYRTCATVQAYNSVANSLLPLWHSNCMINSKSLSLDRQLTLNVPDLDIHLSRNLVLCHREVLRCSDLFDSRWDWR